MKKEEPLFKNTSKMDAKEITVFQTYAMKKTFLWVSIVFALIFIGVGVGVSFIDLTFGIIAIACGLLGGFALLPYLMKENIKKQNEQNLDGKKYLNTYEFFEDKVVVSSESALPNTNEYKLDASQEIEYKDFYQAVCLKEYMFLFLSESQSFVVDYKGMTKGVIADLIEFLKTKEIKIIKK